MLFVKGWAPFSKDLSARFGLDRDSTAAHLKYAFDLLCPDDKSCLSRFGGAYAINYQGVFYLEAHVSQDRAWHLAKTISGIYRDRVYQVEGHTLFCTPQQPKWKMDRNHVLRLAAEVVKENISGVSDDSLILDWAASTLYLRSGCFGHPSGPPSPLGFFHRVTSSWRWNVATARTCEFKIDVLDQKMSEKRQAASV